MTDAGRPGALGELPGPDPVDGRRQHALDLAYRHLAKRDRTVAEMRSHLEAREVRPEVVAWVLDELCEQGYLDDARYARRFAEDRRALDGWGAQRIERRLASVGVTAGDIASAVQRPAEDELGAAVGVLRAKLRTAPDDERGRERALGLLVRRGYDLELAHDAIRAFERDAA